MIVGTGMLRHFFRLLLLKAVRVFLPFFAALSLSGGASAQVQNGSVFNGQGPGPRFGPANAVQSADATPNGTEAGAIQAILPDPALGPNSMFAGSVNGGIWFTGNGGGSWTALTDAQSSLSIASFGLDPVDPTGKTIIAGIGITSNGAYDQFNTPFQGRGGPQNGLLYTTNGGASWSALGTSSLQNQSVIGVAARGNIILAATFEEQAFTTTQTSGSAPYGLYRSIDGGNSFSLVSGTSGLPSGAVTSLVADPANPNRFYAAMTSVATPNQTAVYVSNDLGTSWTPVFTQANSSGTIKNAQQTVITLATGPGGSVAVAVSNVSGGLFNGTFSGLFLSQDGGTNWHHLTAAPNVVPGGQTPVDLHIAIDPANANVVYLSGDAYQTCGNAPPTSFCSLTAYRVVFNPGSNTSTSASLTFEGTNAQNFADANTVHADSRAMAFDASGRLILSSDGGIYLRNNPQGSGTWQGLNGNISAFESYAVAFDANSKRAAIAAQDNGVALQSAPGSSLYNAIHQGDGINVLINDRTLAGLSAIYTTSQSLGIPSRMIINAQGQPVSPFPDPTNPGGVPITCDGGQDCATEIGSSFSSPVALNRIDPTKIALGGGRVYVTSDPLSAASVNATSVDLALTNAGGPVGGPSTIAYGTRDNTNALLVGGSDGSVWASTAAGTPSLAKLTNYAGAIPTSTTYDLRTQQRFFVTDSKDLWYVRNGAVAPGSVTFAPLTANLPAGFIRPSSTEFISSNGVNALLVGGMNVPLSCNSSPGGCIISALQSSITVADSDVSGNLGGWRAFGQGLPNALINALVYNPAVDTLVAGSVGRGVWTLYDVTSNFSSATVLQFGLANNDSIPDASILTGNRGLIKYGGGTLTIAGNAAYTGNTSINGGAVVIGSGGTSGSIIGNVAFCSDVADSSCDASVNKVLAFNRSDLLTFGGSITGPGQLMQTGSGTTLLTGTSTYSGPTSVNAGTLGVNGSITSQVFVNAGGTLGGDGTVGSTTINNAGVLSPGNSVGTLTVQGNLTFAAAAAYLVEVGSAGADRTNVSGVASLGGHVFASYVPGSAISRKYTIVNATGGVTGAFGGVGALNFPTSVLTSLSYDANDAYLDLALNYAATENLNANQQNVGNALTSFFNGGGSIPAVFAALTPAGLSQIAGETSTGSQQATFQAMTQFINALLDPFIDGRGDGVPQGAATPYAEASEGASAYASNGKPGSASERDAYAAISRKAPMRNTVYDPHWSVWAAGFGGSQTTNGDGAVGSSSATSRVFGMVVGADYLLSPRTIAGFALAGGGTNFSVNNFGNGRSDLFQAGAFVRHRVGQAYISGALAYGWQNVTTDRTVTVAEIDKLHANFNANAYSGRVEGGYRFVPPWMGGIGVTPYAAGQFTTFDLPAYAEQVLAGTSNFALGYASRSVTDTRSELGVRADKSFALSNAILTLRGRLAWAHDFNPDRGVAATFQALPGATFVVNGAAQAHESALTTASAEMNWMNGWSAAATFEGEFSEVTRSYAGKGIVRYSW